MRARLRRRVAGFGQHRGLRFGVEQQALAVHGDAIGRREQAERAGLGGRSGDLGHGDRFQARAESRGEFGGLREARRRVFRIGRGQRGGRIDARSNISLVPPPAGINPTPASTKPM